MDPRRSKRISDLASKATKAVPMDIKTQVAKKTKKEVPTDTKTQVTKKAKKEVPTDTKTRVAKKAKKALVTKRSRPVSSFDSLMEEMILEVLSYLKIEDVLSVSQTCSRLNTIVNRSSAVWRKAFVDHDLQRSEVLAARATADVSQAIDSSSVEKSIFFLHKKVQQNLSRGIFTKQVYMKCQRPSLPEFTIGNVATVVNTVTLLQMFLFFLSRCT
jgi:hypothetical protein